jgi:hypothetical protein
MIISISPHIITQNNKKVKSFFEKMSKKYQSYGKKMLEKRETNSKTENKRAQNTEKQKIPLVLRGGLMLFYVVKNFVAEDFNDDSLVKFFAFLVGKLVNVLYLVKSGCVMHRATILGLHSNGEEQNQSNQNQKDDKHFFHTVSPLLDVFLCLSLRSCATADDTDNKEKDAKQQHVTHGKAEPSALHARPQSSESIS